MRAWMGGAVAAWSAMACTGARAQVDDVAPNANGVLRENVARLVADLDAADPRTRESASKELAESPELALKDLEHALHGESGAALSAEQRHRLLTAAFRRFMSPGEPRAAMGVQFDDSVRESGVRLQGTVEGFNAHEALRTGDRVEFISGIKVRDRAHAVAIIVSHDPGDEVELGVVRDGAPARLRVRMGARTALNNAVGLNLESLQDAWAIRSARNGDSAHEAPRVIDCGLPPTAWPAPEEDAPRNGAAVAAGGEARGAPDPAFLARAIDGAPRGARVRRFPQFEEPQQIAQAIQLFRDQAATLLLEIARLEQAARQPGIADARKEQLRRQIEIHREQLRETQQVISEFERQARRMRR